MSGWNNPQTAQEYETYAQSHPMYRQTSRDLVRLAEITANMQVIDLCCGTGITSEAIVAKLGSTGHLYAIDLAAAMLEVAREKITANNVSFHQTAAEKLNTVPTNPVDRIVCNSAFWQLKADETLQAVRNALKADGYFAFNLPGGFYAISADKNSRQEAPNIRSLMRRIAQEDYGYSFPKPNFTSQLDYETVLQKLAENGLALHQHEIISYQQTQAASFAFCTIPIMTERILPDVDYETRMAILKKASTNYNPEDTFTQKWASFITKHR